MTEARANAYLIEQGQCRQCGAFLDVVFDGYEAGKGSESWCPTVGCNTSLHFDCYENFSWSDESPSDYEGEA